MALIFTSRCLWTAPISTHSIRSRVSRGCPHPRTSDLWRVRALAAALLYSVAIGLGEPRDHSETCHVFHFSNQLFHSRDGQNTVVDSPPAMLRSSMDDTDREQQELIDWYEKLIICVATLPRQERAAFEMWDRMRTSDQAICEWPGFAKYLPQPPWERD